MILRVMTDHEGEGIFPTFLKGTAVQQMDPCNAFRFWSSCEIEGYKTYIANDYVSEGVLNRDYNPTELIVCMGDEVQLKEVAYDWAFVSMQDKEGWLPFSILINASN